MAQQTEYEWQRQERELEDRAERYREELEREDIVNAAVRGWARSQRIAIESAEEAF